MSIKTKIISGIAIVSTCIGLTLPVFAADTSHSGDTTVQSYSATKPLDIGTIVELTGKNADTVTPATKPQLQNMFGVTIDRNQLSIIYGDKNMKNQTYVAVSGTYNTLVSTEGGAIQSGDFVTLSSIDGIAMKASTEESTVYGRAQKSFDGTGVVMGSSKLKDTKGNDHKAVKIGMIPVTIDIKRNPNIKSTKVDVPNFLERVGQQIAEKEVSPIRLYLSMAITAISLIIAIAVLYTGVRSSVISIGRNPMSKKSIFRALLEVILSSILILIIGLFAVYLLLKL